jgi:hypothetical protein
VTASLTPAPEDKRGDLVANVSAVLIARPEDAAAHEIGEALASLFEDVVVIDAASPDPDSGETALRELVEALTAAREERVLVVRSGASKPTPHLWIGLSAYPEHDVVTTVSSSSADGLAAEPDATPVSTLYRRTSLLAEAKARLHAIETQTSDTHGGAVETAAQALRSLMAGVETKVIEGADLASLCEADT